MKQTFSIKGMSCQHCVARVENTVKELPGVQKIKVNLKKENGVVKFDDSVINPGTIAETITAAGYPTEVL